MSKLSVVILCNMFIVHSIWTISLFSVLSFDGNLSEIISENDRHFYVCAWRSVKLSNLCTKWFSMTNFTKLMKFFTWNYVDGIGHGETENRAKAKANKSKRMWHKAEMRWNLHIKMMLSYSNLDPSWPSILRLF